jgi:mono/diheme cytochrome c family protein
MALALLLAPLALEAGGPDPVAGYTGTQLFKRFCASCHGADGAGNGPVAPSIKVMIPDLAELAQTMIDRLVEHVRSLQAKHEEQ